MAIHAPAHRPAVHFHFAAPHASALDDLLTAFVVGVVTLAVAWGAMAIATQAGWYTAPTAEAAYSEVTSAAAWDGSAAMEALTIRSQPLTPEAQSLLLYRADERTLAGTEAQSLLLFRAGERESAVTEAESLVIFRAGERLGR